MSVSFGNRPYFGPIHQCGPSYMFNFKLKIHIIDKSPTKSSQLFLSNVGVVQGIGKRHCIVLQS